MWGTHVGPTEAKSLVSTGPRRRSYAAEPARFLIVLFLRRLVRVVGGSRMPYVYTR